MFQILKHFRDFLTPEELKFLPGRMKGMQVIFLRQWKEVPFITNANEKEETRMVNKEVLKVFTASGTYIGEITNPEYVPFNDEK